MPSRARLVATLLALLVGVAATGGCGTTVPLGSAARDDGLGTTGGQASGPAAAGTSAAAAAGQHAPGAALDPAGGSAPTSPAAQVLPSGSTRSLAPGAPIEVGIELSANTAALFSSVGGDGSGLGDNKAQAMAVVNWVNKHGGLGGHRVVPVFHTFDATSPQSHAAQQEQACATYTQDHHVAFATSPFNQDPGVFVSCLGRIGATFVDAGYATSDAVTLARSPNYLLPSNVSLDRVVRAYVERLWARGFLTRSSTIGLLLYDEDRYTRSRDRTLLPLLAAHGLHVAAQYAYSSGAGSNAAGQLSSESSQSSSAVLAFRRAKVDRVLFLASGADLPLLFMQSAENQLYRPKYALHTLLVPTTQAGNPPAQLAGSVGVGWWPVVDTDPTKAPATSAAAQCLAIEHAAGVDTSGLALEESLRYCDAFFFLRRLAALAPDLSPPSLHAALDRLGSSYVSPMTFRTRFSHDRPDGADVVRDLVFTPSCTCFAYDGPPRRAP